MMAFGRFLALVRRVFPDFDTLKPLDNRIYTKTIDISDRNWSAGFPGLRDRFEWFGIEYTGTFRALKRGKYSIKMLPSLSGERGKNISSRLLSRPNDL